MHYENISSYENVPQSGLEEPTGKLGAVKQKLGAFGRKLKRIEIRETIADHPLAAVGIGAAVGAILGFVRPMPQRSLVSSTLGAAVSAVAVHLIREAAMRQLGNMAKSYLAPAEQR